MTGTGFEPVPPKRLVPETSALDRSATQPRPVARPVARARDGGHQLKPPRKKKIFCGCHTALEIPTWSPTVVLIELNGA